MMEPIPDHPVIQSMERWGEPYPPARPKAPLTGELPRSG